MFIQRTQEYHQQQTEEVDFDISYQLQRLADGFTLVADMKLCLGQQPLGAELRNIGVIVMLRILCFKI
jgi:hypothetical protein